MSFAYFMSETYLKDNSPIDINVDGNKLKTAIRLAQEIHIRELIGSGIYNVMCDQINASGLQAPYLALNNDYIKVALVHFTLYEGMDILAYQIVNKGLQERSSEFSQPSTSAITQLSAKWRDKANYYGQRLTDYLLQNRTTFPLYTTPGSEIDTIFPSQGKFIGGFHVNSPETIKKFFDKPDNNKSLL